MMLSYKNRSILNFVANKKVLPLQREGKQVYLQQTHVAGQQKATRHCKAIILQLKKSYLTSFQQISVIVDSSFSDFLSSFSWSI